MSNEDLKRLDVPDCDVYPPLRSAVVDVLLFVSVAVCAFVILVLVGTVTFAALDAWSTPDRGVFDR